MLYSERCLNKLGCSSFLDTVSLSTPTMSIRNFSTSHLYQSETSLWHMLPAGTLITLAGSSFFLPNTKSANNSSLINTIIIIQNSSSINATGNKYILMKLRSLEACVDICTVMFLLSSPVSTCHVADSASD